MFRLEPDRDPHVSRLVLDYNSGIVSASFDQLVQFFHGVAAEDVGHTGGTYMGHCFAVYRDMKRWGADEELARAGLFHSIYGTGIFQRFKLELDRRDEVRALIGERAERLAYLNCAVDYDSFDREVLRGAPPYRMTNRLEGGQVEISPQDFDDLVEIQLVDRLEQVPRSKHFEFRREAFAAMADRLGEKAQTEFERVYAEAEAPQG